ncbi:MAG: ABC transporter substrate-binding protein [Bdellovibrionales bacterium RIFOXYB1_FULL_37_110]|nr:MAG: ABC transporter substrate-binding protein [Bdellovibrionales bacterium RIFOXYC1_FULL_37_79]OFZ57394.1 MAG: ABC transporter substrate-binding protein [Bdellovibrionales bacterium RIFOXYB1_FULL_37_110]OFZ64955.1 MAG: ABC transporter substrate-binding protein [Bdellovibrionales bacterium RIFOXYD1_FULL_36_51]
MSAITFTKVEKYYGTNRVVNNVSFEISNGKLFSLLGPSGCGKTTCLRMIAGLERNDQGTIQIGEEIVSDPINKKFVAPEYRCAGMVFQSYAVWPHMNIFDNIAYPLKIRKMPKNEIKERVTEILEIVELPGMDKRFPNTLSGGQQQRVALARGLVMKPKVLLLDEPLSNLDAKLREKMRADIRHIQTQVGITCVYVTHDQAEAFAISDQIAVMDKGEIVQTGTPDDIRNRPINAFVADFIR